MELVTISSGNKELPTGFQQDEPNNGPIKKLNLWHFVWLNKYFAVSTMWFTERIVGGRN